MTRLLTLAWVLVLGALSLGQEDVERTGMESEGGLTGFAIGGIVLSVFHYIFHSISRHISHRFAWTTGLCANSPYRLCLSVL